MSIARKGDFHPQSVCLDHLSKSATGSLRIGTASSANARQFLDSPKFPGETHTSQAKQDLLRIAPDTPRCYNSNELPSCVAVARGTLDWHNRHELVSNFLESRREGLSPQTILFYRKYLTRAIAVVGLDAIGQDIAQYLKSLKWLRRW